jgi:hypothetical protein
MSIVRFQGVANQKYTTRGRSYTADSAGIISVDTSAVSYLATDVADLAGFGVSAIADAPQFHSRQISSAGVSPNATGADNVIAVYALPPNAFDAAGRGITIRAVGSFAANGNTKRVKLFFNPASAVIGSTIGASGTLLADTGAVATNNGGWSLSGGVYKYGGIGSNTQLCVSNDAQAGVVSTGVVIPALATAVESAAILIAVTGNCTTTATDIVFNFLDINSSFINA